ncbi:MAG: hypothetical protein ACK521_03650 [bacterium]|jgi:hypothetical protein
MFWLGYFLKKRLQDENFQRIFALNKGELEKWLVDHELRSYYFLNQARLIKQNYFLGRTTYRNDSILAIKAIIKEQLKTYQVEDSVNVQLYQRQIPS